MSSYGRRSERALWGLSYKGMNPIRRLSPLYLITKVPLPNTITLGVRISTCEFGRDAFSLWQIDKGHSRQREQSVQSHGDGKGLGPLRESRCCSVAGAWGGGVWKWGVTEELGEGTDKDSRLGTGGRGLKCPVEEVGMGSQQRSVSKTEGITA